jgi:hypothetical protein
MTVAILVIVILILLNQVGASSFQRTAHQQTLLAIQQTLQAVQELRDEIARRVF